MASVGNQENYQRDDFPEHFLKLKTLSDSDGEDCNVQRECALGQFHMARLLRFLHDLFASGRYHGNAVMDICCGPTIHAEMSASKYYENIYMTEFAAPNRRAVEMWRNADSAFKFDWSPHFKLVAKLEGCSSEEVEQRLRRRMRGVYPCDLREERPLGDFSPPPVDCLISVFTLESVAKTQESYSQMMKKITALIRTGGLLVLCGVFGAQGYFVNDIKYDDLYLEESFVRRCLMDAGLVIEQYVDCPVPSHHELANHGHTYFFLAARKQ